MAMFGNNLRNSGRRDIQGEVERLKAEIAIYRIALHRIIDSDSNIATEQYDAPRYIANDALREGIKCRKS